MTISSDIGDHPTLIRVRTGGATVDVAAHGDNAELLLGPYRTPADATGDPAPAQIGTPANRDEL
jgi:hypothetical protein